MNWISCRKKKYNKLLIALRKLRVKLTNCYRVLFKYKHYVIIHIDKSEMVKMFYDEDFDVNMMLHSLDPYAVAMMINKLAESNDHARMALLKAELEYRVEFGKPFNGFDGGKF